MYSIDLVNQFLSLFMKMLKSWVMGGVGGIESRVTGTWPVAWNWLLLVPVSWKITIFHL